MTIALALLLGAVQGLTEFLPISSSGHLRLMAAAFGIDEPQTLFDVCVHAGTLVAVVAYYRREVWAMIASIRAPRWSNPDFRLGLLVVLGTVPAAVVGLSAGDWLEANLTSPKAVGAALLLNGFILMGSRNSPAQGRALHELRVRDALLIGTFQCVALLRGVSRSGTTIVAALRLGVSREAAASFSFLLSIPVIAGALVLQTGRAVSEGGVAPTPLALGAICAGAVGYGALVLLVKLVRDGHLDRFAWYCWGLGAAALALG